MTKREPSLETKAERLLSGGRGPSVREKEDLLARILTDVPQGESERAHAPGGIGDPRPWWRRILRPRTLSAAFGATASLVLLVVIAQPDTPREGETFGVRGEGAVDTVAVWVSCGQAPQRIGSAWTAAPMACPRNETLTLRTVRNEAGWSVAAALYFEDGTLTWIWPEADRERLTARPEGTDDFAVSLTTAAAPSARLLALAVRGDLTRSAARAHFAAHLENGTSKNGDTASAVWEAKVRFLNVAPGAAVGPQ